MNKDERVIVAVDGPSASGKSTVSRGVARRLGYRYVDSGALYRGVAWKALHEDLRAPERVVQRMEEMAWEFTVEDGAVVFSIDGEHPGQQLRSTVVSEHVSRVARIPEVRRSIVDMLRDMTRFGDLVMEGRDIGSVVFPGTPYKYFLDADPVERARRRARELSHLEGHGNEGEVYASLQRRDEADRGRETAPLQVPLGAREVDTTAMTLDEVIAFIAEDLAARLRAAGQGTSHAQG